MDFDNSEGISPLSYMAFRKYVNISIPNSSRLSIISTVILSGPAVLPFFIKYYHTKIGVPQGSILGPLFFIIYINDIVLAPKMFTPIIYADDTTIFCTLADFNLHNGCSITQNINNDLSRILEWLHVNKLCLNANKSKFMLFHSPNKIIDIPLI